jgi:hypothetical protein
LVKTFGKFPFAFPNDPRHELNMAKVKDLKANPKNPRTVTEERLALLKRTVAEFGDISGIIFNKKTKHLVGGHRRIEIIPKDSPVQIVKQYKKPTKTGTVAEGYVEINGERFSYREVVWDEVKEKAATIAANKAIGEWDTEKLSEWMKDLEEMSFDLDLTLFGEDEREGLLLGDSPDFQPGTAGDQGKLDEKKKVICPECGHAFVPK